MCFSATADFVAAGVMAPVGVATLTQVRTRRDVPFAALPILLAAHQAIEGLVWLSLHGAVPPAVGDAAAYLYALFAFGLLPLLVPVALLLIEPPGRRRVHMLPVVVVGVATSVYLFWATAARPVEYAEVHHAIAYTAHAPLLGVAAVGYVIATVGAALLAGYPSIIAFGVVNAVGLTVVLVLLAEALASLWCVWAALSSALVLVFFVRRNRAEGAAVKRLQQQWVGVPA